MHSLTENIYIKRLRSYLDMNIKLQIYNSGLFKSVYSLQINATNNNNKMMRQKRQLLYYVRS